MKVTYQELLINNYYIRGLLSTPDSGEYKNIVVMFHGFTGHKNEHAYLFKQLTNQLVSLNYATLRFDFMGSGDSDGDFSEMTYFTELEEAKQIIDYAYSFNKKPIIVLGFSMGGAIASEVSLIKQEKVEQLILFSAAGNIDQIAKRYCSEAVSNNGLIDMGGYNINVAFWKTLEGHDLYKNICNFTKPVLIIHGEQDMAVPLIYGQKYHDLYPHNEMYIIKGAPHGFSKNEYRKEIENIIYNYLGEKK